MFNVLINIFLVLLIAITALAIVFVLSAIALIISGVKKEIKENNDTKH